MANKRVKVLLAGESWVSTATHVKGFNQFSASDYQTGIAPLQRALQGSNVDLTHMPGHLAPTQFPASMEALAAYDVVVLSDIGADSLLLHPDTLLKGMRTPNRLRLIAQWVEAGGGFLMVGGYLTFQGINGAARYRGTPVEQILPVEMLAHDDRVEAPEGFHPVPTGTHPLLKGFGKSWPYLLGFNETREKPGATVLLRTGAETGDKPLLALGTHGKGRTMAWTSDIGPHWLPEDFSSWRHYGELWIRIFGWLARSD